MEFNCIKESALYITDIEQTSAFYNGILGLPIIVEKPDELIFFRAGNSILICFIAEKSKSKTHLPSHFGEGNLHFAFESKNGDYEGWKELIEKSGILIEKEVVWRDNKKSFYFRDPDNHSVEIVEIGIWDV
ncbi:MAG: catechol 2,3-dioxygenase-like lactoylglutathione lyase family enzyme [Arenicella sp.]|jgi:catechol 2,3-dioxygenase-like lactoylglutathione lyase family enzyme